MERRDCRTLHCPGRGQPRARLWPITFDMTTGEINGALKVDGPAIVDCVVTANEMPNFPHLKLDKLGNYAVAKIKEALLACTGP